MALNEKVLAIDIGSTSIKLCEFEFSSSGVMTLGKFAYREYEEELSEGTRIGVISGLLRQMLAESNIRTSKVLLSMPGQAALIRFGKIPASGNYDRKQVRQLAEFEAQRNLPFALDEVIWDYQLIMGDDPDNVDVMSVVIKEDIVEQYTKAVQLVGLNPILVDVAPAACYNSAKGNDFGADQCVAILNIGGRSSNLVFLEGDRFYARTIPIAGYSITQQIAKEFGIGLPEAEELKRQHGFVALGGAYQESESETATNVSKIIRNVMARLHGEISRTINIYRAQQKGSAPVKMYLTGGSSVLTYCDVFFSEKLSIPVEFYNPFSIVNFGPEVNRQRLEEVAHMFSETIGLALRYYTSCPVEISLLPRSIRRQQSLSRKKPYIIASMVVILVMLASMLQGISRCVKIAENLYSGPGGLQELRKDNEGNLKKIEQFRSDMDFKLNEYRNIDSLLLSRTKWPMIISEINRLKPDELWLTSIKPVKGEMKEFDPGSIVRSVGKGGGPAGSDDLFSGDFMGGMGMDMGMGMGGGPASSGAAVQTVKIGGLEIRGDYVIPTADFSGSYQIPPEFDFPFALPEKEGAEQESDTPSSEGKQSRKSLAVKKNSSPEEVFVRNLRKSRLFSSKVKMTALKTFQPSDAIRNLGHFTLQVKFEIPLDYLQFGGASDIETLAGPGGGEGRR